jgi:hypothetical protein
MFQFLYLLFIAEVVSLKLSLNDSFYFNTILILLLWFNHKLFFHFLSIFYEMTYSYLLWLPE